MLLTPAQIATAARRAGFRGAAVIIMVAICLAESGGNTTATHKNDDGSIDYGVAQIDSVHSDLLAQGDWRDPVSNLEMAHQVYVDAGNSFSPWVTYNTGAFRDHLTVANHAAASADVPLPAVDTTTPYSVEQTGLHVPNPLAPIESFAKMISSADTWRRVLMFLGGAFLVILALSRLSAVQSGIKTARNVAPLLAV